MFKGFGGRLDVVPRFMTKNGLIPEMFLAVQVLDIFEPTLQNANMHISKRKLNLDSSSSLDVYEQVVNFVSLTVGVNYAVGLLQLSRFSHSSSLL